jgi:hypothetical protein
MSRAVESGGEHGRRALLAGLAVLIAAIALGAFLRIHTALTDPSFDVHSAKGLLKSDPGLLYYVTDRIVESGGAPPDDLRADPNIEWPELSDWPAMETVGQEFVVAWCKLFLAPDTPLHVVAVYAMGIFASLAAIGVYGLAFELSRRHLWASLAVLLYTGFAANYRTIGFILIREDFSVPWLALHAYLLVRAFRVRSTASYVQAALALVMAISTWHAMSFVVSLFVMAIFLWFLRSGENPLATPRAWIFVAILCVASLCVPVLWSKLFLLSLPMQMLYAMLVAAIAARRGVSSPVARIGITLGALVLCVLLSSAVSNAMGGGQGDYSHVFALMKAKLEYFGRRPPNPAELTPEVRLLWQGPFATASILQVIMEFPVGALVLAVGIVLAVPVWWRGRGGAPEAILIALALGSTLAACLVQRLIILPGLLTPVVAVVVLRKLKPRIGITVMALGIAAQAVDRAYVLPQYVIPWYQPPGRNTELAHVVEWIPEHIPNGEAIASDFVNSTAILANTRHPVILQPKYETQRSRRRAEEFHITFCQGTPEEFRDLVRRYRCRYVLIDRQIMWWGTKYVGGIPNKQQMPTPGTAAAAFFSTDSKVLTSVPGYRLLYRSPIDPRSPPELRYDSYRLYELE